MAEFLGRAQQAFQEYVEDAAEEKVLRGYVCASHGMGTGIRWAGRYAFDFLNPQLQGRENRGLSEFRSRFIHQHAYNVKWSWERIPVVNLGDHG